jgi:hypothetical protein
MAAEKLSHLDVIHNAILPKLVCAWHKKNFGTDRVIRDGAEPASHGICDECRELFWERRTGEPALPQPKVAARMRLLEFAVLMMLALPGCKGSAYSPSDFQAAGPSPHALDSSAAPIGGLAQPLACGPSSVTPAKGAMPDVNNFGGNVVFANFATFTFNPAPSPRKRVRSHRGHAARRKP